MADFQGGPNSFFDLRNRAVFGAIHLLAEAGLPVNEVSLVQRLDKTGLLEDAGGREYVAALPDYAPSARNLPLHAGTVREYVIRRAALHAAGELTQAARDTTNDAAGLHAVAESCLHGIVTAAHGSGESSMEETLKAVVADWQDAANGGCGAGVKTGIGQLDLRIRGFRPGQFIVFAARPGDGKTSLGMQIAADVAVGQGLPVGVVTLEMTAKELVARLVCSLAGIPSDEADCPITSAQDSAARSSGLAVAAARLRKAPLHICDRSPLSIAQLRAHARSMTMRHKLRLLVVDYIGLIGGSNPKDTAYGRTTEVSKALKDLAKELGIPVLALCQLNRDKARENREPQLYDLRDSGSIEQDADVVLMLHTNDADDVPRPKFRVLIRKQRAGKRGAFDMVFNRPLTRFENDIDQ